MKHSRIWAIIALATFLLSTNRWIDYDNLPNVMDTPDVHDYMSIAVAAPNLPAKPMLFHRAQRFVVPYSLGLIAYVTGIPHKTIFLVLTLFCCGIIVLIFHKILKTLRVNDNTVFLCSSLSFGFLPLLTALAMTAAENKLFDRPHLGFFTLLIVGGSFHHVFSLVGGDLSDAGRFALVYFTFAIAAGVNCFLLVKRAITK